MKIDIRTIRFTLLTALAVTVLIPFAPVNLLILIAFYVFLVRFIKRRANPINSAYWIWFPWAFAMAPLALDIVTYSAPAISLKAVFFILLFLTIASLGYRLGSPKLTTQAVQKRGDRVRSSIARHERLIDLLALLGITGALLFFLEMYFVVGVDLTNLFSVRSMFSNRQATLLSQISPTIAWGGWVSLTAAIIGSDVIAKSRKHYWLFCGLACAALSILSAGRQTVFLMLLLVSMAYMYKASSKHQENRNQYKEKPNSIQVILLASAAIVYMAFVAILRNDDTNTSTKSEYLFAVFGAMPDWKVYDYLTLHFGRLTDSFYEAIIYFSSGVSSFSAFLKGDPDVAFWGKMTFPWIARRLNFLSATTPEDALAQLARYNEYVGAMPVGWSTSFGVFIWDFGIAGSFIVVFAIGVLAGLAWRTHLKTPSIFSLMLVFIANINFFYFLMVPAISDSVVFFSLCGNLAIVTLLRERTAFTRRAAYDMDRSETKSAKQLKPPAR